MNHFNLTESFDEIRKMIEDGVSLYSRDHNASPEENPPVTRIDLQFSLGDTTSSPWVHLHFDTKPGSEPDGDPSHRNYGQMSIPSWIPMVKHCADGELLKVTSLGGRQVHCEGDALHQAVGQFFVDILIQLRKEGVFSSLPTGRRCELGVEEFSGVFGWPKYEERGVDNLLH